MHVTIMCNEFSHEFRMLALGTFYKRVYHGPIVDFIDKQYRQVKCSLAPAIKNSIRKFHVNGIVLFSALYVNVYKHL